jgi:hypothetical protein
VRREHAVERVGRLLRLALLNPADRDVDDDDAEDEAELDPLKPFGG